MSRFGSPLSHYASVASCASLCEVRFLSWIPDGLPCEVVYEALRRQAGARGEAATFYLSHGHAVSAT